MKRRFSSFIGMILVCAVTIAQTSISLLPKPQLYKDTGKNFTMGKVKLSTPVLRPEWEVFIMNAGGEIVEHSSSVIEVELVPSIEEARLNGAEAYRLSVSNKRIKIEAVTEQGVYWAMQTLRQLERKKGKRSSVAGCEIVDWPAFRIRGFMQDVGRSYISMEELKREIEILSRFKINVFHWHLTENQAWRLESKIFPMLNDSVNTIRMPGKYYTLEEARDLVDFCKKHQVLLIPEIDMPGHSAAFVRAFRHDMQSPEGMKILKLLLDEVCETFDVPYLHIGTDEVEFTNPHFVPEMVAYVRSKGKKVISWNPGWHYKPGEIDMTHLWSYRGKAQPGIPAIDSKFHYLNHFDVFGDIVALYNSRIYDQAEGSEDIAGTILALWHDRLIDNEWNLVIENGLYPNMLAIAERAWRGGGTEYFDGLGTILPPEDTEAFKEFADFEKRMLWHKEHTFKGYPFAYVKQTNVKWNITDAFPNGGDMDKVFPPEQELKDIYHYNGNTYGVRQAIGAGIYLRHVWGDMVPAFYADPKENHTAYAYTWVYSPKDQEVGLWAEFQNYSRSEMDLAPLPDKWDYKGSRIWINDREILPLVWTATHKVKSYEVPLGNENCVGRVPLAVHLNKGWNKVFLKLPIGKFKMAETRLVKWMFTAVFVTPDGERAVEGLIYSPDKQK
ncbi:family 20 glycosylhydrolase [Phocaeicola vulgatus]|uniref:family 20 glycosylhydrolase n=1 Tax=Phocaeicola vulgatus TaxID=821 RepID=UPI00210C3FCF|nr:family 20 glycosylhydrolase [Phocaeicola vulgatus]MCQ4899067.1 beta-N-acetylhexosaminidase [Phocaeicola vulgatus]